MMAQDPYRMVLPGLLLAVSLVISVGPVTRWALRNTPERITTRKVCAGLRPGMSVPQVRRLIGHSLEPAARLDVELTGEEGSLTSPVEFGAKNWVLYMNFAEGRLTGWRVRTYDSRDEVPLDNPPPDGGLPPREGA